MDLGAFSQINTLDTVLDAVGVNIKRLRGLRLMRFETPITEQELEDSIKANSCDAVKDWLQQHSWSFWSSTKADKRHHAFIYRQGEIVDYDFSKIHGKDRKILKFKLKKIRDEYSYQYGLFNSFVGKNVLYVHARQGGFNRDWCGMKEIAQHPRWLADVDDAWDNTYCDIYFSLAGLNIDYDAIKREYDE